MQDANETTSSSNTTMKSNHISDTLPLGGEGSNETCGDTDSSRGSIHSHREHGTSFAPPSAADAAAMAAEAERSHVGGLAGVRPRPLQSQVQQPPPSPRGGSGGIASAEYWTPPRLDANGGDSSKTRRP